MRSTPTRPGKTLKLLAAVLWMLDAIFIAAWPRWPWARAVVPICLAMSWIYWNAFRRAN